MTQVTITAEDIDSITHIKSHRHNGWTTPETDEAKRRMHIGLCFEGVTAEHADFGADVVDRLNDPLRDALRKLANLLRSSEATHE